MILITVKLFAGHRIGRFREKRFEHPAGTTAGEILQGLGLATAGAAVLLVNGRPASPERILNDGDVLALFPPVSGG